MPATEMLNTSDHLNHQPASTQPVHQLGGQLRCTWSTLVTSPSRPVTVTSSNIIITSMLSSHFNRWPRYTSPVLGSHVTVRPMPSCSNFLRCRSSRRLHFCIKFQRDVGQLLLDVTNDFALGCCRERVALFCQDLYHVFCEITSRVVAIMLASKNESTWVKLGC